MLSNLLANAVKYSPADAEITVTAGDERRGGEAWARLTVQDRGVGIPATDLPHVFERYYRAGNVVGRFQGEGIGLADARQIVEQHGGTITVHSREDEGSTFSVRLPLAVEGTAASRETAPPSGES